jgi:4-hydroxybenzoyl-CoA reductase subunit alpha
MRSEELSEYSVIGKRLPRVDAMAKATGEAKYTVDMTIPGMLYGVMLRSPYPHAKILNIDTTKAERLPGVKAVITCRDLVRQQDIQPGVEYGLAMENAHYAGEGVVALAAIDNDTAVEALNLIDITYEELPAVYEPMEALREGAPKANTDLPDNVMGKALYHWGDIETGFRQCDHIREDILSTQSVHGGFMEPFVAIASFDSGGKLTFWTACQLPHVVRIGLADRLGMRLGDVRMIVPYMGGSHCNRTLLDNFHIVTAVLSRKSGRPVKMVLSRDEVFIENRCICPITAELKTGVKKDGTLTAMHCKMTATEGPYLREGIPAGKWIFTHVWLFGTILALPYKLPNIKYEGYAVHTNNSLFRAQRGSTITPARFVFESQLDMIADDLGLDPIELRIKNSLQTGDVAANKYTIGSIGLTECLEKVAEHTRWRERKGKLGKNRGLGVACHVHGTGPMNYRLNATAFVHVQADGTVTLIAGLPEQGQGICTVMSQIVAEELGLLVEDIRISEMDTDVCPFNFGAAGSIGTYTIGNAVKSAAEDARRQILQLAAEKLGEKAEDLEMRQRSVYVRDNPEKKIPFLVLARDACLHHGKPVTGIGQLTADCDPPNLETGESQYSPNHSYGAAVAEVEVDTETGQVKVVSGTVAHDCGFALNPTLVEGQIEGQFLHGLGQALYEERLMHHGQMLNPTFADYRMPRSLDTPPVASILVETLDAKGPFGAKECGEGPQGGVAPAIANAVYDAIGVRIWDLPITPEKILKALKEKGVR